MKFRFTDLSIFSIFLSISLFLASYRSILLGLLNFFYPSNNWEKREDAIALVLMIYGVLFFIIAVLGYITSLKFSRLLSVAGESFQKMFLGVKNFIQYQNSLGSAIFSLFLALAMGIAARAYFLTQPMRGDEAWTFLNYVNKDFFSLFNYSSTNNHVLNTLLIKVSTLILGSSPVSIRFPAFLAGVITIFFVFYLARSFDKNKNSGIFAAFGVAVFPYLILFSTNARGYSLIALLALAVAYISSRLIRRLSKLDVVLLALISALGLLALPFMVLPLSGFFLWTVCLLFNNKASLKTILYKYAIPYGLLTGVLTVILYTPVILVSNGVEPIISIKYVRSLSWSVFFNDLIPKVQGSFNELFRDVPLVILLVIFVLFAAGIYRSIKNRNWGILLMMPSLLLGAALVYLFQRQLPFGRTWNYLVPFIFLIADFGFSEILENIPSQAKTFANLAVALTSLLFAVNLMSNNIISAYPDTSAFAEAPIVVQYLKPILRKDDAIRINSTADWSVYFYLWYNGIPVPSGPEDGNITRMFFVVKKSRSTIHDMTERPVIKLLDIGNMELYQYGQ